MKSGLLALSAILFACSGTTTAAPQVAAAWFAGWHESVFPPDQVPWGKYTHMTYAFVPTTADPSKLNESTLTGLPKFVTEARKNGVKPMVSIGGWTGSRNFSTAVRSDNRASFVKAIIDLAKKYNVDGVDFDWEYPNKLGVGCNAYDPKDTANFLSFLQDLRNQTSGMDLIITAAAGITPWLDEDGVTPSNVSDFAKVLDYVAIMNYDIWGSWSSTVGPNAPLDDTCASTKSGSAVSAVKSWTSAGMPPDKIVLGVAAYGHSFRVRSSDAIDGDGGLALYPPFDKNDQPAGDEWDGKANEIDVCGETTKAPGGIVHYSKMMALGYIDNDGNPKQDRLFKFDNCSKTPFIYDNTTKVMVSFDNAESMRAKGEFIKAEKLMGFSMWEVAGDDQNATLVNALRSTSGFEGTQ